ncbi:Zinc finger CCCH domain-containing protein 26 [Hirschfeldia incana]|nr:Zinc finger CCCH domain-containing protein 26 [Hirschfeldia incana]
MPSETQNSTGSVRSSDKTEEDTLTRMKVTEEQSSPYPDRPGERDCEFFLRTGQCGYGNTCRYNHPLTHLPQAVLFHRDELPERIGEPDCEYYLKTGACKYGSTCKYHHPKDRNGAEPVLFNVLGYPMRQGEKSCPYYMQTGTCRFGVACKFHHPHPQPHNGHSATYGMSSFPYGMMSLPPATYGIMPPPQVTHPQAYMPFMFAPPQGWSPYMAGSNPIYNVKTQPDSSSERAECRFFMNTGTCKYGDDCKYSHPNLPHPIVVLPARPGQPACGTFKAYGFCKYGPNCKYDHPPVSTHPRSSPPPPSRSDSTAISNGDKPAAENHSSKIEKQAEVQESSQLGHSDSTAISNGNKPAAENHRSKIEKQDKSEVRESSQLGHCDSTAISNGNKPAAESNSSEIGKQEDISDKSEVQDSSQLSRSELTLISNGEGIEKQEEDISDKSELQESSQVVHSDPTALSNGKTDAESPSSETKKQDDNPSQPDN